MNLKLILNFSEYFFSAGKNHIEHLTDTTPDENESVRLQINRMDIYDAKILTL